MSTSTANTDNGTVRGKPPELNGTQRDLFVAIKRITRKNGKPPYGKAIETYLENRTGRDLSGGVLYQNLDTLQNKGLVGKRKRDGRSNQYYLTEEGYDVYEEYLAWVEDDCEGRARDDVEDRDA